MGDENDRVRLFVYATMLKGERDHAFLAGAEYVGENRTAPSFLLVDLGAYGALVAGGSVSVFGEVYLVDKKTRAALDVRREVPVLFQRVRVRLADATEADTYAMSEDQVRGRRRLPHGDWRKRFSSAVARQPEGAFTRWARRRF